METVDNFEMGPEGNGAATAVEDTPVEPQDATTMPPEAQAEDFVGEPPEETPGESDPPDPESSDSPEPPADQPPVDTDDAVSFPAEILQAMGMTEAQAAAQFGTPERLEDAYAANMAMMIQQGQQLAAQQRQQQFQQPGQQQPHQPQPFAPAPQQGQQQPTPQQQQAADQALAAYMLGQLQAPDGIGEDDQYTPALMQSIQQQIGAFYAPHLQRLDTVYQAMEQMLQMQMQEATQRQDAEWDSYFNSLGDEWKDVFGEGTINTIDRNSQQFQNRAAIANAVGQLQLGRQSQGLPPLSPDMARQGALRTIFGKQHDAIVQQSTAKAVGERRSISRASNRESSARTQAEVKKNGKLAQLFRDRGWPANGGYSDDPETL